jgi:DNA-binding NarL/FixJ family response regulator
MGIYDPIERARAKTDQLKREAERDAEEAISRIRERLKARLQHFEDGFQREMRRLKRTEDRQQMLIATLGQTRRLRVLQVKRLLASGFSIREVADRIGVSRQTISNIKLGKNWKNICRPRVAQKPKQEPHSHNL